MDNSAKNKTQNRRAIIDIGSNSVKLLIADIVGNVVTPLVHEGEQTRLGRGVFETGLLQSAAIKDTTRVVADFSDKAKKHGASEIRVVATSAARDATNSSKLTTAMTAIGLNLEIISGEVETELVLRGVRSHPDFAEGPLALIDVGGGSTELLVADTQSLRVEQSFQLGTVRLLEKNSPSDPPTDTERAQLTQIVAEFLDDQVTPLLGSVPLPETLVGSGGTPIFLALISRACESLPTEEIESVRLSLSEVQALADSLWKTPLAERCQLPGLPAKRADVILFGAAIYETMMLRYGFSELRPTLRGVRYGVMLE